MIFIRHYKSGLILLMIGLVLLLASCSGTATPASEATPDLSGVDEVLGASAEVVPERWANLSFPNGAQAVEIRVKPGQAVSQGEVLAVSSTTQLALAETQAKAALQRAELAYRQLKDLPSPAEIAAAEAALANAKANLDRLERTFAEEIDIEAGKAAVESAQAALDALLEGASAEQLAAAQAEVEAAKAALEAAQAALQDAEIKAPFAGTVVEVYVHSGETALPGQTVFLLADLSSLVVETTDFSEVDVMRIQTGTPAEVTFDAMPDQTLPGTVERIAEKASAGSGVYYKVTIRLKEVPAGLRWGMSAFVEFQPNQ